MTEALVLGLHRKYSARLGVMPGWSFRTETAVSSYVLMWNRDPGAGLRMMASL